MAQPFDSFQQPVAEVGIFGFRPLDAYPDIRSRLFSVTLCPRKGGNPRFRGLPAFSDGLVHDVSGNSWIAATTPTAPPS